MSEDTSTYNAAADLLKELITDPEKINECDDVDELNDLRRRGNPYGIVAPSNDMWLNMSITNLSEQYMRRLLMTSFVGYSYRTLEEYEYELTDEEYSELRKMKSQDERDEFKAERLVEHKQEQKIIRKFLNRTYKYNPDIHVRGSYTDNKDDPERLKRYEAFEKNMRTGRDEKVVKQGLVDNSQAVADDLKDKILSIYETCNRFHTAVRPSINILKELNSEVFDDTLSILSRGMHEVDKIQKDLAPVAKTLSAPDVTHTYVIDPPADVFYNWERYLNNHYEDYREAVNVLYHDKPDLDYAILPYDVFYTEDEAKAHRRKYEKEIITGVITVPFGKWGLLGPFKQNRERVDYYTKDTEIAYQLIKHQGEESKVAAQWTKERVKRKKKMNIKELGADDPGLKKYNAAVTTIEDLGAKPGLTNDEKETLKQAIDDKETAEVPDGAVQVDVFFNHPEKGFQRQVMYTQEDTQPSASPLDDDTPFSGKVVTGRDGRKVPLEHLQRKK